MNVSDIVKKIQGNVLTNTDLNKPIKTAFMGDLLSVVMGKAPSDAVWMTIQSHINIVAVATLIETACIVVTEGYKVDEDAILKANDEDIVIISTKLSSYAVAAILCEMGVKP